MRRPRSRLEVSTFPFLAVLLCVMGSLLLLLFIMDRRAKIAAQYRVTEELQARQTRTKAEEDARQAEWEKAKQALHQTLLDQQNQLLLEANGLQQNQSETAKNVALVQARHVSLDLQRKEELDKIGAIQLEIESRRAGLQQIARKETQSKAELIEAARELADLEQAFRLLKALKQREKDVYSVVPYRGKRGDGRPPIYVECVRDGVFFHPQKKELLGFDFTAVSLRIEVERRFGPLAAQKAIEKGKPPIEEAKGPYVLFLVRPDGIGSYYKAQASLRGFQLDFGYELVDEGWALDFAGNSYAKSAPPSKPGIPDLRVEPIVVPLPPLFAGNGPPPLAAPPPPGMGNGPFAPGSSGTGGMKPGNGGTNTGNIGAPSVPTQPGSSGNPLRGASDVGAPSKAPAFEPIGKTVPLFPSSGDPSGNPNAPAGGSPNLEPQNAPIPGNNASGQKPAGGPGALPGETGGSPNLDPKNVTIPGNNVSGQKPTGGSGAPPGETGDSPNLDPKNVTIPGSNVSGQKPGGAPPGEPGGAPGQPGGSPGGPGSRGLPAPGSDFGTKRPSAPPLSKLLGNKDFVVTIACHGDYVTISPGSWTYRWTSANLKETDQALVESVKNLIARRQASVQPGEPPYRPLIRFHVSSEGRNSFYRAYPLLERLGVPMERANVAE